MKKIYSSMAVKKGLTTLFLLFIYVLGSRITLPFVDLNSRDFLGGSTAYLAFSTALLGGNLRSLSLFSIGLSPWMSSMILWQLLSFSKKLNISSGAVEIQDRRKMYLTLVIALIQSLALSLNLPIQHLYSSLLVTLLNTMLLIAGAFFLVWLSDFTVKYCFKYSTRYFKYISACPNFYGNDDIDCIEQYCIDLYDGAYV